MIEARVPGPADSSWEGAACASLNPEIFFDANQNEQMAKNICRSCPIVEKCLDYAMQNTDMMGIWGATNEKERKALRELQHVARRRSRTSELVD